MGAWIGDVTDQPAAVWWAVRQPSLHPDTRRKIHLALTDSQRPISPVVREAWYYLLEYWEQGIDLGVGLTPWHELKKRISKDGWSKSVVRAYAACFRPYLRVESPYWGNPKPPEQEDEISLSDLIGLEVVYPADNSKSIDIPDEWVTPIVVVLRKNLETALEFETEIDRGGLGHISSIVPDQSSDSDHKRRLSGAVIEFTSVFERLMQLDLKAARREFSKWLIEDDPIFTRLRIWAAGKSDLVSDDQFGPMLADVSDDAFWDRSHEWDLLHTLLARWNGLSADTRTEIEKRLLKGRSRRGQETEEDFRKWCALSILDRITWLSQKGCKLRLNLEDETNRLREFVPDWKPEYADERVESWGTKSGSVSIETEHSALLYIPLASVLSKALSLSGRRDEPFVRYNPFAGLSDDHPVRAFSALRIAAKEGDFPDWAWSTFLNSGGRKNDKPRFMALIAERLACYLDSGATEPVRPAASWLFNVSERLSNESPASFRRVTSALIQSLAKEAESGASEIWQVDGVRDWMTTALNAPAGKIAQSVLYRPQQTDFLEYADKLLALPSDMRRQTVAIFAHWTDWFYANKREWSEEKLLSILDSNDLDDRDAFWGGLLSNTNVNLSQDLFIWIRSHLFQLAKEDGETRHKHGEVLAGIILYKWGSLIEETDERCISDEEFKGILLKADDEFRSRMLWILEKWSQDDDEETRNKWTSLLPEFLRDVWPLQRKANSPAMSVSLCQLVLSNEELFPNLVDIILPCLTKTDDLLYHHYLPLSDNIAQKYPHQMLDLLYKVLPDETLTWPYDIEEILASISEGEPTLRTNEKFLELKRRWDSR
ncbi:MAG: hypothetical protein OXI58_18275 [Gemmatimonadota bacterium]|nr:hypothetical protein [Gemmatimonadota bacterium]